MNGVILEMYKKVLLDTNVILNFAFIPNRLSLRIKNFIDDEIYKGGHNINISEISALEIGLLVKKKKIEIKSARDFWKKMLEEWKPTIIATNSDVYLKACELIGVNNDPCDRIITATSILKKLPLLTSDQDLLKWSETEESHSYSFSAINSFK